jgi:hypothetical protein
MCAGRVMDAGKEVRWVRECGSGGGGTSEL